LKPGLVHDLRADDLGVADLDGVFGFFVVVTLRRQGQAPNAVIILHVLPELVARGQRVVLGKLEIESRASCGSRMRVRIRGSVRNCEIRAAGIQIASRGREIGHATGVQNGRIDHIHFVDIAALKVNEERGAFINRACDVPLILCRMIVGLSGKEWVVRVKC
jgi:hypothetical protein